MMSVIKYLRSYLEQGKKGLILLVDPDELGRDDYRARLSVQLQNQVCDLVLVGGSLVHDTHYDERVNWLRQEVKCPLVLFPGSPSQLHPAVDAVLFLSLVSGRNPEYLIGQHVIAAPKIREYKLETIATGYMLIDGGKPTTASYMSNTSPIPRDKNGIAASTAMAAEMLGMQTLYLDAGSGAAIPVPAEMIASVRQVSALPLIVGGGIRSIHEAQRSLNAGADFVVIGSLFEKEPELIAEFSRGLILDVATQSKQSISKKAQS